MKKLIRINDPTFKLLRKMAEQEKRSLQNLIEMILDKAVKHDNKKTK